MLKLNYFLTDIFILSAEKQPIKLSWRNIEWLLTTADVAEFESPGGRRLEADGKKLALRGADVIIVMEKWQKELLTRFMDYKNWGKIHLFGDICKLGKPEGVPSCDVDFVYRSDNEKMSDVCTLLIEKLKKFFKGDDGAVSGLAST